MDMDDDDAFLYGDESPPPQSAPVAQPAPAVPAPMIEEPKAETKPESGLSAAMAASLAAYGIDPSSAVAAENPEDGGVEEEDSDEEDDSDDEDDVKLVFSGQAQRLDLRRPQAQPSNVIGIGKWAHTSTGNAPAPATPTPATPRAAAPTANQTTEYTPTSRPGQTPTTAHPQTAAPLQNPPIAPSIDSHTAPNLALPPSDLPPIVANGLFKVDPENPSGLIPSTGNSVYDIDVTQFEGSGQLWRRPGSDIQDWFNFGFDEVTYPKFLRYRQEMEAGRNALMNLPMGGLTPEVAQMLHLPNPMMAMNMGQMGNMNQMNQMGNMGNMGNGQMFNPQMQAQMQQLAAMEGMMQQQGMQGMGQGMGQMQGMGQGGQQAMQQRQVSQRASATPAPVQSQGEGNDEVKQEDSSQQDNVNAVEQQQGQAFRGQVPMRGMPAGRGGAMRGRGGAIPSGPRAGVALPGNIPKGPKAGRFKDKDRVETATSDLNYGEDEFPSYPSREGAGSRSVSPSKSERRERKRKGRYRERSFDEEYDSRDGRNRSRSRSRSRSPSASRETKDRDRSERGERERGDRERGDEKRRRPRREGRERSERDEDYDDRRSKRKREEGGNIFGFDSEEEEVRPRRSRNQSEEEDRYSGRKTRKRQVV